MVEMSSVRFMRTLHRAAIVLLVIIAAITASFLVSRPRSATAQHTSTQRTNETGSLASIDTEWIQRAFTAMKASTPTIVSSTVPAAAQASGPEVGVVPTVVTEPSVVPAVVTEPSVAQLVAEVEAAGIQPGSNWTWSMGDTATHCGLIAGAGTGCTYGSGGLEFTIFSGLPSLTLVAHELANAETQNDAVPSLLTEVSLVEAGSSWSPTDAVASCLVEHFMDFQDEAAGSWQCSAALATSVADNIHDTL
jgi:hypothetical protein